MMMNNILTDEQLAEIISGVVDGMPPTTQEEAMARELQERRAADRNFFMYGIAEPDGSAYMEEVCVSHDSGILQVIADELNFNEGTEGYRVVALHTALPLTSTEREELGEYHKASQAARDILAERQRQQSVEGWTPEHDDQHVNFEMAIAGGLYAIAAVDSHPQLHNAAPSMWPWDRKWWKPTNPRRDLVKAAALLLAEIERIDRAAGIGIKES